MSHITILLDQATEARLRQVAEDYGRPVEEIACLTLAETAHAVFACTPERDPAAGMAVLHPQVLTLGAAL
ncbi:hypothetical protein [Sinorhizobium sp. CCBAU 05631]|uniref:hypothetical protein n=1 Tax=Sinorhizobium sp. CCBAU 05631 TaxID=794846 RepID=UPI0004B86A8F|nr:hypothetical protein [Sinorhizobium sp. CCBAU 05631]ASY56457.1 hypothetical protein SS05631_c15210 [Sinorhizobium sp. CCBAU 05631]